VELTINKPHGAEILPTLKLKVLGAGSIGNHLSNAARRLGWDADLVDIDPAALERARKEIYPARYGKWDEAIGLYPADRAPKGGYDLILIGTPPDSHIGLAMAALDEGARAVLVEKPVCTPDLRGADELVKKARAKGCRLFVGYDHVVGAAAERFCALIDENRIGRVQTLDVEFREHWGGIFAAHPWLSGPSDSYLGFWRRGGGAAGEHSHAFNLWQHFAHRLGKGRVRRVTATLDYVEEAGAVYDRLCLANLETDGGLIGRVVQDVVTRPVRKGARVQGADGFIEWVCGYEPGKDAVIYLGKDGKIVMETFTKTRPDDFILELRHVAAAMNSDSGASPLAIERGLDTMMVVAASHHSAQAGKSVEIDWAKGYLVDALDV
jgi:predicted dehydrogenase